MYELYSRHDGRKLSVTTIRITEKNFPCDVIVKDDVGDYSRFRLKCRARSRGNAMSVLQACLFRIYKGLVIDQAYQSLFGDGVDGRYNFLDVTGTAVYLEDDFYLSTMRGRLFFKSGIKGWEK